MATSIFWTLDSLKFNFKDQSTLHLFSPELLSIIDLFFTSAAMMQTLLQMVVKPPRKAHVSPRRQHFVNFPKSK